MVMGALVTDIWIDLINAVIGMGDIVTKEKAVNSNLKTIKRNR